MRKTIMSQLQALWPLLVILLLGIVVRFWALGSLPVILNRDEAALGYNALLLVQQGVDEWGRQWPITLTSFGDYKLLGYVLLLTGFFKIAITDALVRMPSAFAGVGIVVLTYLLSLRLFSDKYVRMFVTASAALLPVFVFYSRMAYEANVALAYVVAILTVLLYATAKKSVSFPRLALLGLLATAAVFTYNTPLVTIPVTAVALAFALPFSKWRSWSGVFFALLLPVAVAAIVLAPITAQKKNITLFSDPTVRHDFITHRATFSGLQQKLFANKYVYYGSLVSQKYVQSFLPHFLVTHGGSHPWHVLPGHGHVYWVVYGLFIFGVYTLLAAVSRKEPHFSQARFWLLLLALSPVPSAITVDAPHATRSLLLFFVIVIISGFGLQGVVGALKKVRPQFVLPALFGLAALLLTESGLYYSDYFIVFPTAQHDFQPGFNVLVQEVEAKNTDEKVLVVDPDGYHYILAAWYARMPAAEFFATIQRRKPDLLGFYYGDAVGRYRFSAVASDKSAQESAVFFNSIETKKWEKIE